MVAKLDGPPSKSRRGRLSFYCRCWVVQQTYIRFRDIRGSQEREESQSVEPPADVGNFISLSH
jgi:hypothetical protein